jgi:ATP-dependent protease HslVU (ClpYQ) peptidase subunit
MSIVVAVNKGNRIVMAADTQTSFGDSERTPTENSRSAKIYRIGQAIFGTTGWAVYDDIIADMLAHPPEGVAPGPPDLSTQRSVFAFFLDMWKELHDKYQFVNDQAQAKDSPFGDLDSSFLIASPGGIFKVSSDLGVTPFRQYYAIGSGTEYALGSLFNLYPHDDLDVEQVAVQSVRTAMAFDTGCGGDVDVLEVLTVV